jgi:hypothetical protein
MVHLFYKAGSKVKCIHAVKGHLDLMMGTIMERMDAGKPLFSFETTEVDPKLVGELLDSFDHYEIFLSITEELDGHHQEISRELLLNLLVSGQEIVKQVRRDMKRDSRDE